jgi:hypothetical protein
LPDRGVSTGEQNIAEMRVTLKSAAILNQRASLTEHGVYSDESIPRVFVIPL